MWQCRDTRPGERAHPGCGLAVNSLTAMLCWMSVNTAGIEKGHDATGKRQHARETKKQYWKIWTHSRFKLRSSFRYHAIPLINLAHALIQSEISRSIS